MAWSVIVSRGPRAAIVALLLSACGGDTATTVPPATSTPPMGTPAMTASPSAAAVASAMVTATPAQGPLAYVTDWLARHGQPNVGIQARAGILVDLSTRQILWMSAEHRRWPPTSLAKMVTVMVALDNAPLDRRLTVPPQGVAGPDETAMGIRAGQTWTVEELLYGVFLASGNDAAETLARELMPRDRFVAAMNAKLASMGLHDSHFVNPTGLDAAGAYTSAYDIAVIAGHLLLDYPVASTIARQPRAHLAPSAGHPGLDLTTRNRLLLWGYPGVTGMKTGFTDTAGGCLAATAERQGKQLIAVVMGSGGRTTPDQKFVDARVLLDYGFTVAG